MQHKLAAFHSYLNRLLSIPLNHDNYKKELSTIYDIARKNGYHKHLIDKLLNKKLNRIHNNNLQNNSYIHAPKTSVINLVNNQTPGDHVNNSDLIKSFRSLTYFGNISYQIANTLNQIVRISFKSSNSLNNILGNNKNKVDILLKSGIYKLTCGGCAAEYIGRTSRNFDTRIKEHLRSLKNNTGFSHYANHVANCNYSINFENCFKPLHIAQKGLFLNNLELLEIHKSLKNDQVLTLNTQLNLDYCPIYTAII